MGKLLIGTLLTLLTYDISVGNGGLFGVIPHFLGFLVIFFGARQMEKESTYFDRLQLPCYIMFVYSAAYYMIKASGLIAKIGNVSGYIVYFMDLLEMIGTLLVSYLIVFGLTNVEHKMRENFGCKRLQKFWKAMALVQILYYVAYITQVMSAGIKTGDTKTLSQYAVICVMITLIFNVARVFVSVIYLLLFYGVFGKYMESRK